MKRTEIVMAGADQLYATEDAVDRALTETGALIATLTRLRVGAKLSGVYGQDAMDAIVRAAGALSTARGEMIRAHGHLDIIKTQMGCKTVMGGNDMEKPDGTHPTGMATSEAARGVHQSA